MASDLRIGVDLGGTKIEAVVLDAGGGERFRKRIHAPQGDYQRTVRALVDLINAAATEAEAADTPVGVGAPGSISRASGLMRNANSTWLNGQPLERDLAAALGRPVRIANDANCFALSEAIDGAGTGANSVFGVIIGTGVGGGLVHRGDLIEGVNGVGGEWGHIPLPAPLAEEAPGPDCWCGRKGCLEQWLSGPALTADFRRAGGDDIPAKEIAARAGAGDAPAIAALGRHSARLGRALGMVANLFDPEVIVLGGGLSNLPGLAETAAEAMRPHVFSDHVVTRIRSNRHGDSSGVRGAARLWPTEAGAGSETEHA